MTARNEVNNMMMKSPPKLFNVKLVLLNAILVLGSSLMTSLEKYFFLIPSKVVLFSVTFKIDLEK